MLEVPKHGSRQIARGSALRPHGSNHRVTVSCLHILRTVDIPRMTLGRPGFIASVLNRLVTTERLGLHRVRMTMTGDLESSIRSCGRQISTAQF